MLTTVQEATQRILNHRYQWMVRAIPFDQTIGLYLAEDIHADRPFPPFDRVMMDGIAINSADFEAGTRLFAIAGMQAAGSPPVKLTLKDTCVEVMTGAVLPAGTDCVIRYEEVQIVDGEAIIQVESIKKGQNIHPLGSDRRKGERLLSKGQLITAADVALFATVGKTEVWVKAPPRVCVLSTGDELIPVSDAPLEHQIRRSNVHALVAALQKERITAHTEHLPDSEAAILATLRYLLTKHDVLLLSGGVSKGKFDHLPACFEKLAIEKQFHFVQQRPGKPFWFGIGSQNQAIFAFPGNPVSTFVGYHRYFLTWLRNSFGLEAMPPEYAVLAEDFTFKPDLTYFLQCRLIPSPDGRLMAQPEAGKGSGDLANLADVDGFLELPTGQEVFEKGSAYRVFRFR